MSILVSGSLAYDYILDVPDRFADHLLPDQLHVLSVCFGVERLERSWGGTAGNIAYAMRSLGANPLVISAVGSDGEPYLTRLEQLGMSTASIYRDPSMLSSAAYIMTDKANNQITGFFPGPLAKTPDIAATDAKIALISPNPVSVMSQHLRTAKQEGMKAVFDPGQALTLFTPEELHTCIKNAWALIGNDYEIKLLMDRTGYTQTDLLNSVELFITTLGAEGSRIETSDGQSTHVPACAVTACVDPTGAGDAYRAGFFVGYEQGKDLKTCAQMGSVLAGYAVETYGTQAYNFTKEAFCERYKNAYQETLDLS
jgi:adenosine kinase